MMDILQPGQMLGAYRIISQVGQGGMATVYKAFQASMNRYVALKILPRQLAESPEYVARFEQEARIIASLEHPHILPVYDYGENDGLTYLVMRFLDAGTLKSRMSEGRMTLTDIDRCFAQLVDALGYAHTRGVVHRDMKPSNVLVDERGNLFLTDFGIARLLESSAKLTHTGAMIGTPDYMSPEQGQGNKVDQRSDIYSLGIILYEMVTGRVPFEAETPLAVVLKHISAPLPLPSSLMPDLPLGIERVLLKALAKAPEDRFSATEEFYEAWKQALMDPGLHQTRPSTIVSPVVSSAQAVPAPQPATRQTGTGPAPSHRTASLSGVQTVQPAPQKRKWSPLYVILAVMACLLLAGLAAGGVLLVRMARNSGLPGARASTATAQVAGIDTQQEQATPDPSIQQSPQPARPLSPGWTSWVGGNHIWTVLATENEVISAGNGVSVWNRQDGSLLRRWDGPPDGLPDVFVNHMILEADGTLWLATPTGLARYGSERFTYYDPQDGLDSSYVSTLAWTSYSLLIGTQYCGYDGCGLQTFDEDGIQPFLGFPSAEGEDPNRLSYNINTIMVEPDDTIWVGTGNGLARYDEVEWKVFFQQDGLPANGIYTMLLDNEGTLIVGTAGGAAMFDGQAFKPIPRLTGTAVYGIVQDFDGNYWFSTDGAVVRFDPDASDWESFGQDQGLPSYTYYRSTIDKDGNLYFGSDNGLVRYDGSDFTTWELENVPSYGSYSRILPDPEGSALWFVQQYGGSHPDRLDLQTETWSTISRLPDDIDPMLVDVDRGTLWSGGGGGAWSIDLSGSRTHLTVEQGLPSNTVNAIVLTGEPGAAWIGTDSGLAQYDGQQIVQVYNQQNAGLTGDEIRALLLASDGSLWVATRRGLDRLLPGGEWLHFPVGDLFYDSLEDITDLAEDSTGSIWVSTVGEGRIVRRFVNEQWQVLSSGENGVLLPENNIKTIAPVPDGSIWFGGYYSEAVHFDGRKWQFVGIQNGLVYSDVNDIYIAADGSVWFATTGGVSRFVPR